MGSICVHYLIVETIITSWQTYYPLHPEDRKSRLGDTGLLVQVIQPALEQKLTLDQIALLFHSIKEGSYCSLILSKWAEITFEKFKQ